MSLYLILKALHLIAVISWMAGMLYLPRLFVYHAGVTPGSEASEMLKIMERRLLRIIINPAMIVTFLLGLTLASEADAWTQGWFHAKLTLVLALTGLHHMLARHVKHFRDDKNTKTARYFRLLNEIPTILMIGIVFLAVLKPF